MMIKFHSLELAQQFCDEAVPPMIVITKDGKNYVTTIAVAENLVKTQGYKYINN